MGAVTPVSWRSRGVFEDEQDRLGSKRSFERQTPVAGKVECLPADCATIMLDVDVRSRDRKRIRRGCAVHPLAALPDVVLRRPARFDF